MWGGIGEDLYYYLFYYENFLISSNAGKRPSALTLNTI